MKPISRRTKSRKGASLSIGVDGRMYLSAELREILNHNERTNYYLFFDDESEKIGISKVAPNDMIEPFSFTKRGEGNVVSFVEDCEIQLPGKPVGWLFEEEKDNIYI